MRDHLALPEEHGFGLAPDQSHPVPEVGAHGRQVIIVAGIVVDVMVAPVGEQACEGDQREGGMEFRAHAAFGLCVETLDHVLSGLVSLLDLPAPVVEVRECLDGVAAVVQGCCETVFRIGGGVFDYVRWLTKQAYRKLGVSGQVDLVQ